MADKKEGGIYKSVAVVFIISLLCRVFGFLREIVIGNNYGTDVESDAYFMAIRIFTIFALLFGYMWTTTYTPIYTRAYGDGTDRKEADRLTTNLLNILILAAIVVTALLEIFAEPVAHLIAPGFDGAKLKMTVNMCRIIFPALPFYGLYYYFSAVLNSQKKFAIVEGVTIFVGLGVIMGLYIFKGMFGAYAISVGAFMAYFLQFAFMLPSIIKSYKYRPQSPLINFKEEKTKEFFKLLAPSAIGVAASEINNIIDSMVASTLVDDGKVAALNYSQRINTFAISVLVTPIITVIFTKLSEIAKDKEENKDDGFSVSLRNGIEAISMIAIPVTALVMASSTEIIKIIYQRGAFDENSVKMTAFSLMWYIFGLAFYGYKTLFNRAFYALKNTVIPMIAGFIVIGANLVFDLLLKGPMDVGGLALANAIGMFAGSVYVIIVYTKKFGKINLDGFFKQHFFILLGSAVAVVIYVFMGKLFSNLYLRFLIPGALGLLAYAAICIVFKVRQFTEILDMILRKLHLKKGNK